MTMREQSSSVWFADAEATSFPRLQGSFSADVVIVGAGITGLTSALLLTQRGRRVAVVEAGQVAGDVSGHTTAHLTAAIDTRYSELIKSFGLRGAQLAAQSSTAAIDQIEHFVTQLGIDCDFARVPGYLYGEDSSDRSELEDELAAALRAGLAVSWSDQVPLPFDTTGGLLFAQQAQFNPVPYLQALAKAVVAGGGMVFEHTRVIDVDGGGPGDQVRVQSEGGQIQAAAAILATHAPIHDTTFLQDLLLIQNKLSPYRSYVIGVRLTDQNPPEGLFWDNEDPYHYLRSARDSQGPLLIVGGEDHRTGEESETDSHFDELERYTRERFPVAEVAYRWSSQWYEPADGLPYIGKTPLRSPVWLATGYSGNGMTFGTLAGMLLADDVMGRANPWSDLYAANRIKPLASAESVLSEGAKIVQHFIGDRFEGPGAEELNSLQPEEGRVLRLAGEQVAVYCDKAGQLHAMSAVCTHAKCIVNWNSAEQSWDCPCHGGRYNALGEVLNGPPVEGLDPVRLVERR